MAVPRYGFRRDPTGRRPMARRRKRGKCRFSRDYSKATGQLGLESQRRSSEMSQNAGSEEAESHGTRFSALFLGILSTQSRIGPGCLATVSTNPLFCDVFRLHDSPPFAETATGAAAPTPCRSTGPIRPLRRWEFQLPPFEYPVFSAHLPTSTPDYSHSCKQSNSECFGSSWGSTIIGPGTYAKDQPVIRPSFTATVKLLFFSRMPRDTFL